MPSRLVRTVDARGGVPVSEKQWQHTVVDTLHVLGYRLVMHQWLSARSTAGYPDITALRETAFPRVVWLELKGTRGKPTPAQLRWIAALNAAMPDSARVVYPHQYEEMVEWLKR